MPVYDWNSILFRSGDLFLRGPLLRFLNYYHVGNDTSVFYINNWSIVHFLSGVAFATYFQKKSRRDILIYALVFHTLWELWQIYGRNTKIETDRGRIDVLVDTSAFLLGILVFLETKKIMGDDIEKRKGN